MILYNKRNIFSFRNHVVTAHMRVFPPFFSYMDGQKKVVAGDDASSLDGSAETPLRLSRQKMTNDESSCTSARVNHFVKNRSYGPNHPHQRG